MCVLVGAPQRNGANRVDGCLCTGWGQRRLTVVHMENGTIAQSYKKRPCVSCTCNCECMFVLYVDGYIEMRVDLFIQRAIFFKRELF